MNERDASIKAADLYAPKKLFKLAARDHKALIYANALAVCAALCSVPVPLLLPLMVDEVLLNQPGMIVNFIDDIFAGPSSGIFYIGVVLAATIILRLFAWAFNVSQLLFFLRISKSIVYEVRVALLRHLGRASLSAYDHVGGGTVASRLVTDINTLDDFIGTSISNFLVSALIILATAAVVLLLHWQLALFLFLLNPLVIYFTMIIGRKVKQLKKKENTAVEIFQQAVTETLEAIHQIRASNRTPYYVEEMRRHAWDIRTWSVRFKWRSDASSRLSFLVFLIGFDIFRVIGMLMVLLSDLSIGQMIAVFGYLWFMLGPLQEVLNIQYAWYGAKAAIERIQGIFDMPCEPQYPALKNPFVGNKGVCVEVRDLRLAYSEQVEVLAGVNLKIEARQKVALVGASGGGKTTLIYSLLGLRQCQSGQILYGDVPMEHIGLETIRDNVSCVLQQPVLQNTTIRENLLFGRQASDDNLWEVLRIAQMEDFTRRAKDGLDTFVGVKRRQALWRANTTPRHRADAPY